MFCLKDVAWEIIDTLPCFCLKEVTRGKTDTKTTREKTDTLSWFCLKEITGGVGGDQAALPV